MIENRPGRGEPTIAPFGDAAVLITFPGEASIESAARSQALASRIRATVAGRAGWGTPVAAAASVLVRVDSVAPGVVAAVTILHEVVAALTPADDRWPAGERTIEVPVRYGGDAGPDLGAVAELTGLAPAEVIERHAAATYRALFLGFAPGFGYLGPLAPELVLARRATPRVRVPAGSVAIAGPYTAIYPNESPGGWHLLGRTSATIWDPKRDHPATFEPGTLVRFVPERP